MQGIVFLQETKQRSKDLLEPEPLRTFAGFATSDFFIVSFFSGSVRLYFLIYFEGFLFLLFWFYYWMLAIVLPAHYVISALVSGAALKPSL